MTKQWPLDRAGADPGRRKRCAQRVGIDSTLGTGRVTVGGEDWAARSAAPSQRRPGCASSAPTASCWRLSAHERPRPARRRGGAADRVDADDQDRAAETGENHRAPGKYHRTAEAGLNTIVPFLDAVRDTIDLREQITKIEPQPVITRDNVTMEVDAVIYSVIVDPVRATYEVQNLRWGLEQLTLSALRNVIGQLDLDHTLSSRDSTNSHPGIGLAARERLDDVVLLAGEPIQCALCADAVALAAAQGQIE